MPVVNGGPQDTEYLYYPLDVEGVRVCHPKGLIVASSYKMKQTITIITIKISTNITFMYTSSNSPFNQIRKNDKCKGGAHLRISFWYLLMNLKKNY